MMMSQTVRIISQQNVFKKVFSTVLCSSYKASTDARTSAKSKEFPKTEEKIPLMQAIRKKIFRLQYSKERLYVSSVDHYESIADKLDYPKFFKVLEKPDTFMTWFYITQLHVWMLMARLMMEGKDGLVLRDQVITAMWVDVDRRMRKLGVTPNRDNILDLHEQFQAAVLAYDEGIMGNDMVLAAAIWRIFFCKEYVKPEIVEQLVGYVRKQVRLLDDLTREDILLRANIKWISLDKVLVLQS